MSRRLGCTLLALFFLGSACASPAGAAMVAKAKIQAGIPPFTIMEHIMRADSLAATGAFVSSAPLVTWLAPSDPRIQPDRILAAPVGKLYEVRTLGGLLQPVAASVDYGVRQLRTPLLLITTNTDNPVLDLLKNQGAKPTPDIAAELQQLATLLPAPSLNPDQRLGQVEQLVDGQVRLAVARYQDRIKGHQLSVVGGVIDLANLYKRGAGRLIIINVNGETDVAKLGQMSIMRRLDKETRDYLGRRGMPLLQTPAKKRAKAAAQK